MKPDSLTCGEWEPKLAECFFTLPRLDISMSRVSVTMNKPVNDTKANKDHNDLRRGGKDQVAAVAEIGES